MSCTFDTNILVYTLGQPADVKRQRAQSPIIRGARRQTAVLLLQSLAEFSYVATRKFGVSVASVRWRVNGWCGGFPVQTASLSAAPGGVPRPATPRVVPAGSRM